MYFKYFTITGFALTGGYTYNILENMYISKNSKYGFMYEKYNFFNYGFFIGMGLGSCALYINSKLLKSSG
jgi:hypothetical protein